jgi:hypothetical protein
MPPAFRIRFIWCVRHRPSTTGAEPCGRRNFYANTLPACAPLPRARLSPGKWRSRPLEPANFRAGFHIHATAVYHASKPRSYSMPCRLERDQCHSLGTGNSKTASERVDGDWRRGGSPNSIGPSCLPEQILSHRCTTLPDASSISFGCS